jgi:hypothetical protein
MLLKKCNVHPAPLPVEIPHQANQERFPDVPMRIFVPGEGIPGLINAIAFSFSVFMK